MAPATRPVPLNDEVDAVPLLQDPLQLGDPVGAGTFKGDLVRDAHNLHSLRVTGDLSVGDGDHVVQAQGFRWGSNGKAECKTEAAGQQGPRVWSPPLPPPWRLWPPSGNAEVSSMEFLSKTPTGPHLAQHGQSPSRVCKAGSD